MPRSNVAHMNTRTDDLLADDIETAIELGTDLDGLYVSRWYDRSSRSYVTALTTRDGSTIGPAAYDGSRADAAVSMREYSAYLAEVNERIAR